MLDRYIYRNLDRYGNCLISNHLYKKLGKTKILEILKQNGYNCDLRVVKTLEKNKIRLISDTSVIIEVKR